MYECSHLKLQFTFACKLGNENVMFYSVGKMSKNVGSEDGAQLALSVRHVANHLHLVTISIGALAAGV